MKKQIAGAGVLVVLFLLAVFPFGCAFAASKGEDEMKKGLELYSAKEYAKAADHFQKASSLLEKEKKVLQAADASYNEGLCRRAAQVNPKEKPEARYKKVINAFERAAKLYERAKEGAKSVNSLLQCGQVALTSGKLSEAEKWYSESLFKAKNLQMSLQQGLALEGLGFLAYQQGRVGKSCELLTDACELLSSYPAERLRVSLKLAAAIRKSGDMVGTLKRLEEAETDADTLAKNEKTKNIAGLMRFAILAEQGHTFLQMGIFNKAQEYLKKAFEFEKNNPMISDVSRMNLEGNKLVADGEIGETLAAIDQLQKFQKKAEQKGLPDLECTSLISRGRLLRVDGKYVEAMDSLEKAATIAQKTGLANRYLQALMAKANLLYFQGVWKEAENAYRLAFNKALEQGDMESVLVAILGIERIARANHIGISGKVDYRKMQGIPWKGALLQRKDIRDVNGGNGLAQAWASLEELSRTWFVGSEPGLRGAMAVTSAGELLSWDRIIYGGRFLLSEGVLNIVRAREKTVLQLERALFELGEKKEEAKSSEEWNRAYSACWNALARAAGRQFLVAIEPLPTIQYDGFLFESDEPAVEKNQDAAANTALESKEMLQTLRNKLLELLNEGLIQKKDLQKSVQYLVNGKSLPDFLKERIIFSANNQARKRAALMELRLSSDEKISEKALKEFSEEIYKILERLGSSPLDELRGNQKLSQYLKGDEKKEETGLEGETQEARRHFAASLAESTPPLIIYSLLEALEIADVEEAWRSFSLRVSLLKKLGVLDDVGEVSLEQGEEILRKSLLKGMEIFSRRFVFSQDESNEMRMRKVSQMASLAKELVHEELSSHFNAIKKVAALQDGHIGFYDKLALRELLARFSEALGDFQGAARLAESIREESSFSEDRLQGTPNPEIIWRTLLISTKASLAEGDMENALRFAEQGIVVMESVSPVDAGNSSISAEKLELYSLAIETAFKKRKASPNKENTLLLWRFLEGMKSRQWREMLAGTGAAFLDRLPKKEREYYQKLNKESIQLLSAIAFSAYRGDVKGSSRAIEQLQAVREQLSKIAAKYSIDYAGYAPTFEDVFKVLHPDWPLVNYYISRELSFAFVLNTDSKRKATVDVIELPLDYDEFFVYAFWMRSLPQFFGKKTLEFEKIRFNDKVMVAGMSSPRLASQLFSPVSRFFGEKKRALIIPHDLMFVFPYETMSVFCEEKKKEQFLVEMGWVFAELPSAFLLTKAESKDFSKQKKSLAVVADPEYPLLVRQRIKGEIKTRSPDPSTNINKMVNARVREKLLEGVENQFVRRIRDVFCGFMKPLENAAGEANTLVDLWKKAGHSVKPFLGANASEKTLYNSKEAIWNYRYVHFVCHGYDRNSIPDLQPGLALSPFGDTYNDSFAQMGELAALKWNVELLVLSACDTGLGDLFIADGMVGLSTVFLAGGAKGIVISRWRVADDSAPVFMGMMYQELASGKKPVEALSIAQNHFLKGNVFDKASHWAVFKYVGIPW